MSLHCIGAGAVEQQGRHCKPKERLRSNAVSSWCMWRESSPASFNGEAKASFATDGRAGLQCCPHSHPDKQCDPSGSVSAASLCAVGTPEQARLLATQLPSPKCYYFPSSPQGGELCLDPLKPEPICCTFPEQRGGKGDRRDGLATPTLPGGGL